MFDDGMGADVGAVQALTTAKGVWSRGLCCCRMQAGWGVALLIVPAKRGEEPHRRATAVSTTLALLLVACSPRLPVPSTPPQRQARQGPVLLRQHLPPLPAGAAVHWRERQEAAAALPAHERDLLQQGVPGSERERGNVGFGMWSMRFGMGTRQWALECGSARGVGLRGCDSQTCNREP